MSWTDRFISEDIASNDEEVVRAKLFLKITVIFSVVGVLYATLYATSMDFLIGAKFLYSMAVINAMGILIFYKTQNVIISGNYLGLMLFSAFLFLTYTSGGMYSSANSWFGIMVLVTLLIAGVKTGLFWGIIAFGYLISLFILTKNGHPFPENYGDGTDVTRQLIGYGGGVLLISILALIFENNKNRAYKQLDFALNSTVRDLDDARENVFNAAAETADKASECVEYSGQVNAKLAQINEAVKELNTRMSEVSSRAENSVSTVNSALSLSKNSYDRIGNLRKRSDEIGKVVDIIRSITTQINLLALNAGVEAVRAGEAGGSFSVVAEEIKNLANKTTQSTNTIEETVGSIRSEVDQFIRDMDELSGIMNQVSAHQGEISEAVVKQNETTSVMVSSIQESTMQGKRIAELINDLSESAIYLMDKTETAD